MPLLSEEMKCSKRCGLQKILRLGCGGAMRCARVEHTVEHWQLSHVNAHRSSLLADLFQLGRAIEEGFRCITQPQRLGWVHALGGERSLPVEDVGGR
jgi:hypothetical protein